MNNAPQKQIHPAQVAQEFMSRTDLKGNEVEVYAQTFNWLAALVEEHLTVIEAPELEALRTELAVFRSERDAAEEVKKKVALEMDGKIPVLTDVVELVGDSQPTAAELEDIL